MQFSRQRKILNTIVRDKTTVINGGVKVNVVPDECRLQVDIRTVPAQDHGRSSA